MKDNFRFKALAVACVVTMLAAGSAALRHTTTRCQRHPLRRHLLRRR